MADDSKGIRARSRHLDGSTISKPAASGIGIEVEPTVESSIDYDSDGDVDMGAVKSTASGSGSTITSDVPEGKLT